jgi:hypothetical protein
LSAKAADYSQLKNWESTKLPTDLDTTKFETARATPTVGLLRPPAAPFTGQAWV